MPNTATNFHGVAVVLGDRGVLIAGPSGSGKTGFGLALITHVRSQAWFARLVADDQVFLEARNGKLVCIAPAAIAGLAEIRGIGPRPVAFEPKCRIDLLVRLAGRGQSPRFQEAETEMLEGCATPCLTLSGDDRQSALFAVASYLSLPPFA
jgi:serine kinase of HPr protein (carbohydrate metabolism regulator)